VSAENKRNTTKKTIVTTHSNQQVTAITVKKEYDPENPNAEPVFLEYDAKFNDTVKVNLFDALIQVEETNLINTWFSLVTETGTLSEKTFKLIYYGHPFIIVGCDHILKDLHNLGYKTFDFIQLISKWSTPFCLGGYMLVRSETFKSIGGFDEDIKVAEDYIFSKQIKPKKFGRINNIVFTPPRRFENKGVMYMLRLMLSSFFNSNNKEYFTNDKDYWK
jgi:hypothetical protein